MYSRRQIIDFSPELEATPVFKSYLASGRNSRARLKKSLYTSLRRAPFWASVSCAI